MIFPKINKFVSSEIKIDWRMIARGFACASVLLFFFALLGGLFLVGVVQGYKMGQAETEGQIEGMIDQLIRSSSSTSTSTKQATPTVTSTPKKVISQPTSWGGPELWDAVNKRRVEFGVNPLQQRDELCTIASIRLNEQLELGRLDNHEGFTNMKDRRPDLAWIFEKYSTMAEFLAQGGKSASETVSLWENTLGHKKLLTGGEYVWGCIYAQDTFAVAITAY